MRITRRFPILLCAFAVFGAPASEPAIASLSWLSGCWASENGEPGSGEHWTSLAGGTMLGTSRTVEQGKTVGFEFMELRYLQDGRLAFIAHPSGQRTTALPALRASDSEAVFENRQHDFPQRVVYAREGDAGLRARIEGVRKGVPEAIDFPMRRVACSIGIDGPAG
jgi:hypothetical protein